MTTAITNARVFDGKQVIGASAVVIDGGVVRAVGESVPVGATVVDAGGGTLLPGLIDSHCHTSIDSLRLALRFGVTTELDMMGYWPGEHRHLVAESDDLADVRAAGMCVTAPGGHPTEYGPPEGDDDHPEIPEGMTLEEAMAAFAFPFCSTAEETITLVAQQIALGSDYIKIMIEDGTVVGHPGLPVISDEVLEAAVAEAHRHGKLTVAHVTTIEGARRAVRAGVDGLGHLFLDGPHTPGIVAEIVAAGTFVIPTLTVVSSAVGHSGAAFASDERVSSRLSTAWLESLRGCANVYPQGRLEDALGTVAALQAAGVDILAGTDVTQPSPEFGGLAHGASVHHELQLLVAAGLTPVQALRAATSTPARRFGLTDRGRISAGARADLLLVDGDPTTAISDTLSIRAVWRCGVLQAALV
ncbi:MAG: amidohydrolase family protein [Candidatus Limnocylindrales bacterium]